MAKIFLHIALAILVFTSSSGLMVSKHYCQGKLVRVALFHKAKSCHESSSEKSCPLHPSQNQGKKGCCKDKSEYLKIADQLAAPVFQLADYPFHPAAVDFSFQLLISDLSQNYVQRYLTFKPPIVCSTIYLLLQTFLL